MCFGKLPGLKVKEHSFSVKTSVKYYAFTTQNKKMVHYVRWRVNEAGKGVVENTTPPINEKG